MEAHLQIELETIRKQEIQIQDMGKKIKAQDDIIASLKDQMVPKTIGSTAYKRPGSVRK